VESERRREYERALRETALFVPNFVKLVGRLLRDPRVPRRNKWALGFLAAYLATPIDLVPDFIPVIGYADDVVLVTIVLTSLIRAAGPEVVQEHWDGAADLAALLERTREAMAALLPRLFGRWRP
jgi:uncharacterized membrane protein YkvA (DUF1232 family)